MRLIERSRVVGRMLSATLALGGVVAVLAPRAPLPRPARRGGGRPAHAGIRGERVGIGAPAGARLTLLGQRMRQSKCVVNRGLLAQVTVAPAKAARRRIGSSVTTA